MYSLELVASLTHNFCYRQPIAVFVDDKGDVDKFKDFTAGSSGVSAPTSAESPATPPPPPSAPFGPTDTADQTPRPSGNQFLLAVVPDSPICVQCPLGDVLLPAQWPDEWPKNVV